VHAGLWWGNVKDGLFVDIDVGEMIIVKWILRSDGVDWIHLLTRTKSGVL
jgi:hypothetical protein